MLKFLILLIFYTGSLFANNTLLLEDNSHKILPYSEYSAVKDIDELPDATQQNIWYKDKNKVKLNDKHTAYWIKINIKNTKETSKKLYLIDERRYVYSIDYYLVQNSKVSIHKKDGFYVKENTSSFNASQRIFPLFLEPKSEATIYLKVQSYNMLDIPAKIVTEEYLIEYLQIHSFLEGAFFFVLLVMVMYNLITYLIVKIKAYLYYLSYVFFLLMYQVAYFGYLKVVNCQPELILSFMVIGIEGFVIFSVIFVKELFHLKKYLPRLNKAFILLVIYLSFLALIDVVLIVLIKDFYWAEIVFNIITISVPLYVFMLLYALYYLAYKRVNKIILAYTFVWTVVSIFGLSLVGMHFNILSTSLGIDYLFQIGMFFETILFSLMLSYRIKEIEQETQNQERMIIQQSRLASMGEIISTIAHQWRQPLSHINGCVLGLDIDYRKKRLTDERMEQYLLDIETTTTNMSATINDFMDFFNMKKELETFSSATLIDEVKRIVKMTSLNKITFTTHVDKIELTGYKSELIQVLLIVINNSLDAYCGIDRANITIAIKQKDKNNINITIEDYAGGILDEVLPHVFEPYFTTKHKSQGTGLGLYILKMIIENGMEGKAMLENSKNGTLCTITIPKVIA